MRRGRDALEMILAVKDALTRAEKPLSRSVGKKKKWGFGFSQQKHPTSGNEPTQARRLNQSALTGLYTLFLLKKNHQMLPLLSHQDG